MHYFTDDYSKSAQKRGEDFLLIKRDVSDQCILKDERSEILLLFLVDQDSKDERRGMVSRQLREKKKMRVWERRTSKAHKERESTTMTRAAKKAGASSAFFAIRRHV